MDGKSRRYAMIPAFGMVILPHNPNTGNGQVPGWSCILSMGIPFKPLGYCYIALLLHRFRLQDQPVCRWWARSACAKASIRSPRKSWRTSASRNISSHFADKTLIIRNICKVDLLVSALYCTVSLLCCALLQSDLIT